MPLISLANKSALVLLYSKSTEVDFGPYNLFASIIQRLFREYNVKRRATVCIQGIYRGFAKREILFWGLASSLNCVDDAKSLPFLFRRMQTHHASVYHNRILSIESRWRCLGRFI